MCHFMQKSQCHWWCFSKSWGANFILTGSPTAYLVHLVPEQKGFQTFYYGIFKGTIERHWRFKRWLFFSSSLFLFPSWFSISKRCWTTLNGQSWMTVDRRAGQPRSLLERCSRWKCGRHCWHPWGSARWPSSGATPLWVSSPHLDNPVANKKHQHKLNKPQCSNQSL